MYTIVFYKEDTLELVHTQETDNPSVQGAKYPFYIVEGEFSGTVNPSDGLDKRSDIEKLQEENKQLRKDLDQAVLELSTLIGM